MKLAYFVHDLADPAVSRRLKMLKAGGAEPVVIGFRRTEAAPDRLEDCPVVALGQTFDARLGHRAKMTAKAALRSGRLRRLIRGAEVVLCRQLEMLAVGEAARWTCGLTGSHGVKPTAQCSCGPKRWTGSAATIWARTAMPGTGAPRPCWPLTCKGCRQAMS